MNKKSAKLWVSMMLLFTFVAGQLILFAHTHKFDTRTAKHFAQKDRSRLSDDDCPVCAQHGNFQLLLPQNDVFQFWTLTSSYRPVAHAVQYQSIQLLLSGNRGPPTV
ncbi:hypothetical protein LLH06_15310 [Mucilaginibacter daejeonensis]|uniref:hypothetical protein n=1 Tax=Mucilaginibacter daejeonensis TaxID=398049 RepID=UPI001D17C87B|nr:hypothetical protein [Mucilaginibacter daejeonensis]UEG52325.1 hypothetical protein LLH06_15310 [Mucilaginibacter daejeonensis]